MQAMAMVRELLALLVEIMSRMGVSSFDAELHDRSSKLVREARALLMSRNEGDVP